MWAIELERTIAMGLAFIVTTLELTGVRSRAQFDKVFVFWQQFCEVGRGCACNAIITDAANFVVDSLRDREPMECSQERSGWMAARST